MTPRPCVLLSVSAEGVPCEGLPPFFCDMSLVIALKFLFWKAILIPSQGGTSLCVQDVPCLRSETQFTAQRNENTSQGDVTGYGCFGSAGTRLAQTLGHSKMKSPMLPNSSHLRGSLANFSAGKSTILSVKPPIPSKLCDKRGTPQILWLTNLQP